MGWKSVIPWGAFYGGPLLLIGVIAAGGGHGTYVPLGVAASPVSVIPDVGAACLMIPVLWGAAGGFAASSGHRVQRYAFRAVVFLHYAAMPLALSDPEHFGDWHSAWQFARWNKFAAALFVAIYAAGQAGLWWYHFRAVRHGRRPA